MKKIAALLSVSVILSCQGPTPPADSNADDRAEVTTPDLGMHPDWTAQSSIYEVNIRQHTPEGTIAAFAEKLPEIKELGVEILWIMPVQPIGEKNRKGPLGSYYSISDYTAVNPEFGTMEDFKAFVDEAHDMGFKVILDWVANHSSFDNVWMEDHKDWYTQVDGVVISPNEDWTDVADLNYDNPDMRKAMRQAMKFWVEEADIDGYRCDVAFEVPMDFWNNTRMALDSIKPVFMLAEAEGPEFHEQAFDMTYGWEFHHIINEIAAGEKELSALDEYQSRMDTLYNKNDFRMFFTTNHDENSWNGTINERMGENAQNFFVLCATFPNGMPLVYSGQEYGLDKRLRFFDKDTIEATDSSLYDWYRQIVQLKMSDPTLKMGNLQGDYTRLTDTEGEVFAFVRQKGKEQLVVALNFGDDPGVLRLPTEMSENTYEDPATRQAVEMDAGTITLEPHNYKLLRLAK